jgi:hypothetical protein
MKKNIFSGFMALGVALALAFSLIRFGPVAIGATVPPPQCFTNAAGQFVCNIPGYGPGYATPSPVPLASTTTGTTGFVYQVLQSLPTTCGFAPSGTCLVIINGDMQYPAAAPTAVGFLSPCVAVSSTPSPLPTTLAATYPAQTAAPCASSAPANALAGAEPFAEATTLPLYINALSRHVAWTGTIPTNSSFTFLLEVEGSSTTSEAVQGSGSAVVIPF